MTTRSCRHKALLSNSGPDSIKKDLDLLFGHFLSLRTYLSYIGPIPKCIKVNELNYKRYKLRRKKQKKKYELKKTE